MNMNLAKDFNIDAIRNCGPFIFPLHSMYVDGCKDTTQLLCVVNLLNGFNLFHKM